MEKTRVGILGTGWAASVHAKSLLKLPDVSVVAVCNRHAERAQAFNEKVLGGGAKVFADWRVLIDAQNIDALYVCIPPGAQEGQGEYAAERGIHLMLEKPIALTSERADSIASAVRKARVKCQIGHHMRHSLPVRKLKEMLEGGTAGRPLLMQGRFFGNALYPAWWRDPDLGGGQLIEQAIHIYDLARHFMGEPAFVSAFADNLNHQRFADYRVDDVSASVIRFASGGIASLCASNCAEPNTGSITFTLHCEKLIADFADPHTATFIYHGGKVSEEVNSIGSVVKREQIRCEHGEMYDELSANFVDAIRNGAPLRSTIEDGVESLRLVLAAAASARDNGNRQRL